MNRVVPGSRGRVHLRLALVFVAILGVAGWIGARGLAQTNVSSEHASRDRAPGLAAAPRAPSEPAAPLSASIGGRVIDENATAVAGAEVCAWGEASRLQGHIERACDRTDTTGRYWISVPAGAYRLGASASGFLPGPERPRPSTLYRIDGGQTLTAAEIVLQRGGEELTGIVMDVLGGAIEGATVVVVDEGPFAHPLATATSGEDGTFSLWVSAGRHSLRATAEGYARAQNHVSVPGRRVELLLAPASSIKGVVIDEAGTPIANANVELRDHDSPMQPLLATTVAAADGSFALEGLAPGRYRPSARKDRAFGEADHSVAVGLAQSVDDVVIRLAPSASLVVHVTLDDASSCPEGVVLVTDEEAMRSTAAEVGADGRAEIATLSPGAYSVIAVCSEIGQGKAAVAIEGPQPTEVTVAVARGYAREGFVRGEDGQPIRGVAIDAFGVGDGASTIPRQATSDADGRFVLAGLAPGAYALRADSPQRAWQHKDEFTVSSDRDAPLQVVLETGATIHGRVLGTSDTAIAGVIVGLRPRNKFGYALVYTDTEGRYRIEGIPAGEYEFSAEVVGGSRSAIEPLELRAGMRIERDVRLAAQSATIGGVLTDDEGSPVADAWVYASREDESAAKDVNRRREVVRMQIDMELRPALTDAEGRFVLTGLSDGPHTITARRPGGGETWQAGVAAGSTGVRLRLPAMGSLAGSVTTRDGAMPSALMIRATHESGLVRAERFNAARSTWRLDDVASGRWSIVAQAREGRGAQTVTLDAGEDRKGIAIELVGQVTVQGKIVDLDTGEPLANIAIAGAGEDATPSDLAGAMERAMVLEKSEQFTGSDGRFSIRVPAGTVRLLALPRDLDMTTYGAHWITAVAAVGRESEVQTFALVKSRVAKGETPGSIGHDMPLTAACEDVTVGDLDESSAAYAAGLRPGDRIIAVDGHDVADKNCYRYYWLVRVPKAQPLKLTLADGRTLTVTPR